MKNQEPEQLVEIYLEVENWTSAKEVIEKELEQRPHDHWWLARLSIVYYEQFQYHTSLEIIEKAYNICPTCPLILWDYAGTLDMIGREKEAISIWRALIRKGVERIAYDECGEGRRWAQSLLNDCFYRVANTYCRLGKGKQALQYIQQHIAQRRSGISSLYSMREARKKEKEIQALFSHV